MNLNNNNNEQRIMSLEQHENHFSRMQIVIRKRLNKLIESPLNEWIYHDIDIYFEPIFPAKCGWCYEYHTQTKYVSITLRLNGCYNVNEHIFHVRTGAVLCDETVQATVFPYDREIQFSNLNFIFLSSVWK